MIIDRSFLSLFAAASLPPSPVRRATGQLYGLEKFWAFLKYYKNSDELHIDSQLQEYLSKFKSIEDFRVVEVFIFFPFFSPDTDDE